MVSSGETALSSIAQRGVVEEICKNMRVDNEYFDDLTQEVYYILLTGYTDETLRNATNNKQEKYIITSIIKRQWLSKSSPFYKKYKRYKIKSSPIEDYKEEGIDEEQGRILPGRTPKTPPGLRR